MGERAVILFFILLALVVGAIAAGEWVVAGVAALVWVVLAVLLRRRGFDPSRP